MLSYFDPELWNSTLPSPEYREQFKHKKLLLINVGGNYKYHVMKRVRDLGVGHIVVLDTPNEWFLPLVDGVIHEDAVSLLDADNPENDPRILSILDYQKKHQIEFDGIWTFADRGVILTSQIAAFFWKPGLPCDIIPGLKNKHTLRTWLFENRDILGENCPHVCSLPCLEYKNIEEKDFPLILKGVESYGKSLIKIIYNQKELDECVQTHGLSAITLEPYFEGTDIDFNITVQDGKIFWSWFVQNSPARQPWFLENGSQTCTCINNEEQNEIILYTQNILNHIEKITEVCLHIEFRISHQNNTFSFTLIEINFRLWGGENFLFALAQDSYDLILANMEIAFWMNLSRNKNPIPSDTFPDMKTNDFYTTQSGTLQKITPPQSTNQVLEYLFYAPVGMPCNFPPGPDDDIGYMITHSSPTLSAHQALNQAMSEVVIKIGG